MLISRWPSYDPGVAPQVRRINATPSDIIAALRFSSKPCPSTKYLAKRDVWPGWFFANAKKAGITPVTRKVNLFWVVYGIAERYGNAPDITWDVVDDNIDKAENYVLRRLNIRAKHREVRRTHVSRSSSEESFSSFLKNCVEKKPSSPPAVVKQRLDSHGVPKYVPRAWQPRAEGKTCPKCKSKWFYQTYPKFLGPSGGVLADSRPEFSKETPYARLWRHAESALYRVEEFRELHPEATPHQVRYAESRFQKAHKLICKCDMGNLAARRPGLKLNLQ